jgi:hypothetical protein
MFHLRGVLSIYMTKEKDLVNAACITNGQSRIATRQETIYIFFSKKNSKNFRTNKFFSLLGNLRYYEKIRY